MADTIQTAERVNEMWLKLAEQMESALPDILIEGRPEKAIRWAACAEACYWKSTGEDATHDVQDVLNSEAQP